MLSKFDWVYEGIDDLFWIPLSFIPMALGVLMVIALSEALSILSLATGVNVGFVSVKDIGDSVSFLAVHTTWISIPAAALAVSVNRIALLNYGLSDFARR